jgi:hypothetical protein
MYDDRNIERVRASERAYTRTEGTQRVIKGINGHGGAQTDRVDKKSIHNGKSVDLYCNIALA